MSIIKAKKLAVKYFEQVKPELDKIGTVLYLNISGSHLYGCSTEKSDIDVKGVILPHKSHVLCAPKQEIVNCINLNGTIDGVVIDFEVWTLQYLQHLLCKGDSNVIDMLYSQSYDDAIIHATPHWYVYFNQTTIRDFILFNNMSGIVGYCNRQAEIYGNKGNRYNELLKFEEMYNDILKNSVNIENPRLRYIIDNCDIEQFDHIKVVPLNDKVRNQIAISVLGRLLPEYLWLYQVQEHIDSIKNAFGKRTIASAKNNGKDAKAISHAYRAGVEYIQLLTEKQITFPVKNNDYILQIKLGNVDYEKVQKELAEMLETIAVLNKQKVFNRDTPKVSFLKFTTLGLYNCVQTIDTMECDFE